VPERPITSSGGEPVPQRDKWAVFLIVALALIVAGPSQGTEPDGYLAFRPLRIQNGGGTAGVEIIRLDVRTHVAFPESRLTVAVPSEIAARVLSPSWEDRFRQIPGPDGVRLLEADIGEFEPGSAVVIRFEFTPPDGAGGIVSFTVDGATADGREVREATGISIGQPGAPGNRRHGAIEYPAVPVPEATR
jgi:hypothetical protein